MRPGTNRIAVGIGLLASLAAAAGAQELEPRAYANAPVGLNFLIVGYGGLTGEVATDPAAPLQNAELDVHGPVAAYARSFGVAGRSAKVDVIVPYGFLSGTAELGGEPVAREISGLWDPRIRFSMSLWGAPALSAREFATWRQDWIVGWSVQVGLPLGQYDETRLVNLGNNRWAVKPELGVSKLLGRWNFEAAVGVTFYGDNDDFFGGQLREQEPVYALQTHVVHTFPSRIWVALDANYYTGGAVSLDGVETDGSQSTSRVGATASFPFGARNSLKLYLHTGVSVRTGGDFDAAGVAWQHRWGGGLP